MAPPRRHFAAPRDDYFGLAPAPITAIWYYTHVPAGLNPWDINVAKRSFRKSSVEDKNQIVVYQPNDTIRLDVRLENETVWLSQSQMAVLFGCSTDNVGLHLKNIYSTGELLRDATTEDFSAVRLEGARQVRRTVTCYNLDAIISVGYRVNSVLGIKIPPMGNKRPKRLSA